MRIRIGGWKGVAAALLVLALPGSSAEVRILEPADKSIVRGVVQVRIQPIEGRGEQYFSNPDVTLHDDTGRTLATTIAVRDAKTRICTLPLDTRFFRDGVYRVSVYYRNLSGNRANETRADLELSFRNTGRPPARFSADAPAESVADGEGATLVARAFDERGKPLTGARVSFATTTGELDTTAELTGPDGEATAVLQSEQPVLATVTVQVESLPAVKKVIRFVAAPNP